MTPKAGAPQRLTYTVTECALALGVSKELIWSRIWDCTLPSVRVGRRVLVPRAALEALVNGPTSPAGANG